MEGLTEKVNAVDATEKVYRNSSKFPLNYHLYQTQRFADITPHYVDEIVPKDRFTVRNEENTRSYTLKAPLMSDVFKKKAYFQVPMMAILPFNWDKYYQQPTNGDDVDASEVGPTVTKFLYKIARHMQLAFVQPVSEDDLPQKTIINYNFQLLTYLESIFSSGSLAANLGAKFYNNLEYEVTDGSPSWIRAAHRSGDILYIDEIIDLWATEVIKNCPNARYGKWNGNTYEDTMQLTVASDRDTNNTYVSMHRLLEKMRDDCYIHCSVADENDTGTDIIDLTGFTIKGIDTNAGPHLNESLPLRMARLWSYQLTCAHYFTNDHVDYIYNADLFRQQLRDIESKLLDEYGSSNDNRFEYNGVATEYDYMSAHWFNLLTWQLATQYDITDEGWLLNISYFRMLFSYKRSLRYLDYFTGSKPRPLAVGNIEIDVSSDNTVSAIDVTRNIQRQRFFNAVNRFGRRPSEYIKGLFGQDMAPDYHNPFYLGMTTDLLYGAEVENNTINPETSENANQVVTATFKGNSSKFAFEMQFDRPSIVIGLSWYDIPRAYVNNYDRKLTHVDRFDEFNPYMQQIGDQKVMMGEFDTRTIYWDKAFSYGLRHIEYKTRVSEATGGFANGSLPGWTFLAKEDGETQFANISPDFIRSRNDEIDDLYLSLTGYSLGTYWHFIVDNYNEVNAVRPMAYAPSIL